MQRLILFRHAKAERRAASGEDYDRDLTERGRRDAQLVARALVQAGVGVDLALVSASRRTRSTWEAVAAAFPLARVRYDEDLYCAPAERLLAAAQASQETGAIMVVAHNPGIFDAVLTLIEGGGKHLLDPSHARLGMPTATAVVFDWRDGKPALIGYHLASAYGGGGGE